MPIGLFITNEQQEIAFCSKMALAQLSLKKTQFVGKKIECFLDKNQTRFKKVKHSSEFSKQKINQRYPYTLYLFAKKNDPSFNVDKEMKKWLPLIKELFKQVFPKDNEKEKLLSLARFDNVTGLPNRSYFQEVFERAILNAKRHNRALAIFYIDLDDFKMINDTKGHSAGDKFLRAVSKRLLSVGRKADFFARIGGDEFVLISEDISIPQQPSIIARRILDSFSDDVIIDGDSIKVSLSIGIAVYPMAGSNCAELLKNADTAMYKAKKSGKNKSMFFSNKLNDEHAYLRHIEKRLKNAIRQNEFFLEYQPIVDLNTEEISGFEALLRWQYSDKEILYPGQFIKTAEDLGVIHDIGKWVIQTACHEFKQAKRTFDAKYIEPKLSLNLSAIELKDYELVNVVEDGLRDFCYGKDKLELEISESALMENIKETQAILAQLEKKGISLAIDDFGTGYSSLSYLSTFPFSSLKIDASFIRALEKGKSNKAIVNAIIHLGHTLGLNIIAEGIESSEQQQLLLNFVSGFSSADCFGQGYLFGLPTKASGLAQFVQFYYDDL